MRLVVVTVIFVSEIMSQNVSWLRPPDKGCEDYKDIYYMTLEKCLKDGLIVDKDLHDCYKLLSKGPCDNGEMLVFTKGPCLQTQCVANRNSSGTPCPDGWFNYKGTCTEPGSPGCADQFGRRVRPDLYGDVQCLCDRELGFVEFKGECYFEFSQGPCQDGEQLITDISRSLEKKCVKNTCDEGFILVRNGTQNICYGVVPFIEEFNKSLLTSKEDIDKALGPAGLSGLKPSCHTMEAETTGKCLETTVEPDIGPIDLILLDLKTEFNLTSPPL